VKTLVSGGTVVLENGTCAADVLIGANGTIECVASPGSVAGADEEIDARGLLVFPGMIDGHSHLNDPGNTESEDFYTGTCGAAGGGMTTVLEMPQTIPLVDTLEAFVEKRGIAETKAVVDYGLWGALTIESVSDESAMGAMVSEGAIGFKAFTTDSPEILLIPDNLLRTGLARAAELGVPVGVHCEDQEIITYETARLKKLGRNDPLVNPDSRPPVAEIEAVRRVLLLAEMTGARVHLAHISLPESVELAREAKNRGVAVTVETCGHYFEFTREDTGRIGAYAMCNPPLREAAACAGMWRLLASGAIDTIGSDHSTYTEEEKGTTDFWAMPAGISGIQLLFPFVVGEAIRRGIDPSLLGRMFSANVARVFGLYPRKGVIQPGSDADLTLVEPGAEWVVRSSDLFTKCPGTPYEGHVIRSRVRRTIVRGTTVFLDDGSGPGRITAEPGFGQYLTAGKATASQARPGAGR